MDEERVHVEKEPNSTYWWVVVDGKRVGAVGKRDEALNLADRVRTRIEKGLRP